MIIWLFRLNVLLGLLTAGEVLDYCLFDVFNPKCDKSYVIVVNDAKFGRMRLGRCIQVEAEFETMMSNQQYLGCYADVTDVVGGKCSGENHCNFKVSDLGLRNTSCFKSLEKYLEVEYDCLKVIEPNSHCSVSLATESPQFFLKKSKNVQEYGNKCGSKIKPFTVETLPGQNILMTITDHGNSKSQQIDKPGLKKCSQDDVVGYVTDKNKRNTEILCNDAISIPVSFSNHVELFLEENYSWTYLLKIEVTGCSDLIPPADAWLKRTENEATIGCYSTRLRWKLKCVGQRWIGVIGNCSYVRDDIPDIRFSQNKSNDFKDKNDGSQVFTITIICAIGIILCSIIVCCGIICLKRYNQTATLAESFLSKAHNFRKNETLMKNQIPNNNLHNLCNTESKINGSTCKDDGQYFALDDNLVDEVV